MLAKTKYISSHLFSPYSANRANEDDADSIEDVKSSKSMTKKRYPFCNTLMATSPRTFCTSDGKSVGSCNLVTFGSNIPQQYQNFDAIEGVPAKDIGKV